MRNTYGLMVRGIVLATYMPGDADHPLRRNVNINAGEPGQSYPTVAQLGDIDKVVSVCCDVLTYGTGLVRILRAVPVMQMQGASMGDVRDQWIPRPCSVDTSGRVLTLFPGDTADPDDISRIEDLDGDHVIVAFLENDALLPVVIGAYYHPRTETSQVRGQTTWRHRGITRTVDPDGNVTIDLRNASSGAVDATGIEQPGAGGDVTIELAADQEITVNIGGSLRFRLQNGEVTVDAATVTLGSAALEAIVKGVAFQTLYNTHVHPVPTVPPVVTDVPAVLMGVAELSSKVRAE